MTCAHRPRAAPPPARSLHHHPVPPPLRAQPRASCKSHSVSLHTHTSILATTPLTLYTTPTLYSCFGFVYLVCCGTFPFCCPPPVPPGPLPLYTHQPPLPTRACPLYIPTLGLVLRMRSATPPGTARWPSATYARLPARERGVRDVYLLASALPRPAQSQSPWSWPRRAYSLFLIIPSRHLDALLHALC
ncbi:hypothetical protein C8R43DRAFT_1210985 [Mycena crocata]|nr:hypothetical protein C8R43DRAFT_1210985 [Mycena crocata]